MIFVLVWASVSIKERFELVNPMNRLVVGSEATECQI